MTPKQIDLARHALGLSRDRRVSFRNHFSAGPGHVDYAAWRVMVAAGLAREQFGSEIAGWDSVFHLTREGATAALRPGERLDQDDFPPLQKVSA